MRLYSPSSLQDSHLQVDASWPLDCRLRLALASSHNTITILTYGVRHTWHGEAGSEFHNVMLELCDELRRLSGSRFIGLCEILQ